MGFKMPLKQMRSALIVLLFVGLPIAGGVSLYLTSETRFVLELRDSGSVATRLRSVERLASLGGFSAIPSLAVAATSDSDASVRDAAKNALERLRQRLLAECEAQLEHASPSSRLEAAHRLGDLGEVAIPALAKALANADQMVRHSAIDSLQTLKAEAAIRALVSALPSGDDDLRHRISQVLLRIGAPAIVPLMTGGHFEVVPPLAALLKAHDDPIVRAHAAFALGAVGGSSALPALGNALRDDKSRMVAEWAAFAIGSLGDPKGIDILLSNDDKLDRDRRILVHALARIGHPDASRALGELLKHSDRRVAEGAALALCDRNDPHTLDLLIRAIHPDGGRYSTETRAALIEAVGRYKDDRAVDALIAISVDYYGSPSLRTEAKRQLLLNREQAVDRAILALKAPPNNSFAREQLTRIIVEAGDRRAIGPLVHAMRGAVSIDLSLARAALNIAEQNGDLQSIIQILVEAKDGLNVHSSSRFYPALSGGLDRPAMLRALGEPAVVVLESSSRDKDIGVRVTAVRLMAELKDDRTTTTLINLLRDPSILVARWAALSLGQTRDSRAIAPLVLALASGSIEIKEQVIWALGNIGDPASIPALTQLLLKSPRNHMGRLPFDAKVLVEALVKIDDRRVVALLIDLIPDTTSRMYMNNEPGFDHSTAVEELVKLGPKARGELKEATTSRKEGIRWGAITALARNAERGDDDVAAEALMDSNREVRLAALAYFKKTGNPRAAQAAVKLLSDWEAGPAAVAFMNQVGWKAQDNRTRLLYAAALRDNVTLLAEWKATRALLLEFLSTTDDVSVEFAVKVAVSLSQSDFVAEGIAILNSRGTRYMASVFLNSGHSELEAAARAWAKARGYSIYYQAVPRRRGKM